MQQRRRARRALDSAMLTWRAKTTLPAEPNDGGGAWRVVGSWRRPQRDAVVLPRSPEMQRRLACWRRRRHSRRAHHRRHAAPGATRRASRRLYVCTELVAPQAHCATLAKQGSADLLCRRVLLLLLALNPRMTDAQRELLQVRPSARLSCWLLGLRLRRVCALFQAMVRASLERALYEHSVEAPVLRSIVVLACPSQVRCVRCAACVWLLCSFWLTLTHAALHNTTRRRRPQSSCAP